MSEQQPWFVKGVSFARTHFTWLERLQDPTTSKPPSDDFLRYLTFTGLNLDPQDIILFAHAIAVLAFIACLAICLLLIILSFALLHFLDLWMVVIMGTGLALIPFASMNLIAEYPRLHARTMRIQCLGDIPEVLSYLVMSLKLVPNLENSVKFAARESKTPLAADLRKLLWDMEIRVYHGVDEALTAFSTYWGQWHEYLRRSLHLIRSSVCEHNEVSRGLTLDRALEVSLEGTKETMNRFVNALHQPTMILYSVGIMIPLSLVAMLPAAGLVGIHLSLLHVFFLYDVSIPLIVYLYMWKILLSRPATFSPPDIPSTHPDLARVSKKREALLACGVAGAFASPFFASIILPKTLTESLMLLNKYIPLSLFVVWGLAGGIAWYCLRVYTPYKRIWDDIKAMEREFSDALYVLGRRLAEDRSPEESIQYTAKAIAGARIAEVFTHTGYLLQAMNITVREAFFHPEFGSLRFVSSDRIKAITRLIVEGMGKSQQAVSLSIIRIADHLRELQDVEGKIRDMLHELTSTLQATATVFAPLIAGVTLSITSLITSILGSVGTTLAAVPEESAGLLPVSAGFSVQNIASEWFVLVIGVYVVELVVLLTRFTNGITDGDDRALFLFRLGRTMVVAVVVFSVTVAVGMYFFGSLAPVG